MVSVERLLPCFVWMPSCNFSFFCTAVWKTGWMALKMPANYTGHTCYFLLLFPLSPKHAPILFHVCLNKQNEHARFAPAQQLRLQWQRSGAATSTHYIKHTVAECAVVPIVKTEHIFFLKGSVLVTSNCFFIALIFVWFAFGRFVHWLQGFFFGSFESK